MRQLLVGLLVASGLVGCAAIPWPTRTRLAADAPTGSPGLRDLRGVVHVHTRGSHDSPGTLQEVVRAARAAGVVWVALTEHTRWGTFPEAGQALGVTLLPGLEIRAGGGSLLAIGVSESPPDTRKPEELVDWIHAAGGVAFVSHFEKSRLAAAELYQRASPDGIEIINLHAAADAHPFRILLSATLLPAPIALKTLLRTPLDNLARWARLDAARTIVGGVDAHAKIRVLGPLGGTVDRYRDLFRLLTTHVLARDATPASILEALRAGRSYVALEGLARVDAFRFETEGASYRVEAPRTARLALICDGREVDSSVARRARLSPPPGSRWCRAEAWLGKRLWVVTSYLDAPGETSP